jgi:hypothetical protein
LVIPFVKNSIFGVYAVGHFACCAFDWIYFRMGEAAQVAAKRGSKEASNQAHWQKSQNSLKKKARPAQFALGEPFNISLGLTHVL